jgi:hypothetical protein
MGLGSGIRNPEKKPIPDPGSGSATLVFKPNGILAGTEDYALTAKLALE